MNLRHSNIYFIVKWANKINDFKWWVLHRTVPRYRYHVHKFHRLSPGWHDVDYKILHACFDFLVEYVEKEKGLETLKFQYTWLEKDGLFSLEEAKESGYTYEDYQRAKEIYTEIKALYDWWKSLTNSDIEDLEFFSKENSELCTNQLIRLIKMRRFLWT